MGHAHAIHKIGGSFLEGIAEGFFHATAEKATILCCHSRITTRIEEEFTAFESVMEKLNAFEVRGQRGYVFSKSTWLDFHHAVLFFFY
jgi:hypothetical protein